VVTAMNEMNQLTKRLLHSVRGRRRASVASSLVLAVVTMAVCASTLVAQVRGTYLHTLSNFAGRIPYDWARIYVDQERDETYVVYQNLVRVFNQSGMEIFSFGDDLDLGQILDVAVDLNGNIILLSYKDSRSRVTRCNYRGVLLGPLEITNLPAGLDFGANRMMFRNGLFYFANLGAASVIITDATGAFRERIDLNSLLDKADREKGQAEIIGFSVDKEGNIFFTIPVLFRAFKLSADRTLTSFGRPGSAPGRFGIVAGIVADGRGNVLVVDKLKRLVMAFDKDFRFLTEFGSFGPRQEGLIAPDDITIDKRERVYVTQGRKRGVAVFALTAD
jgi:hypothetical protein